MIIFFFSETTEEGKVIKILDSILLNGNQIAMIVPGAEP
jgi:hypothetical protein